jgi:sphingolipid delta-4 desaturase
VSNVVCLGPHPTGGRWIAEHFAFNPKQETYSYYGPINYLSFNVGYHNEHHDFSNVAWLRLPLLTRTAPDYYDTLTKHSSYLSVIREFVCDPNCTLQSRALCPADQAVVRSKKQQ